jgi:hypothetical protein
MLLTPEQIQIEALSLPPHQREELVARLLESLGEDDQIEAEWLELARNRLSAIRSGNGQSVAGDSVLREAREIASQ